MKMIAQYSASFQNKCFAIVLSDSVHVSEPEAMSHWLQINVLLYIASSQPLNTPENNKFSKIPCYSARHEVHEWTPSTCLESHHQKWFENKSTKQSYPNVTIFFWIDGERKTGKQFESHSTAQSQKIC